MLINPGNSSIQPGQVWKREMKKRVDAEQKKQRPPDETEQRPQVMRVQKDLQDEIPNCPKAIRPA